MATRVRTGAAPSDPDARSAAEVRVRKPRTRAPGTTPRKSAGKRASAPVVLPEEGLPAEGSAPVAGTEPAAAFSPPSLPPPELPPSLLPELLPELERAAPLPALPAEPPPDLTAVLLSEPGAEGVVAEPFPAPPVLPAPLPEPGDALTGLRQEFALLRADLRAQADQEAVLRAGALTQALRLATAAAHHLDQVSREVCQAVAQVREIRAGLSAVSERLGQREEELRTVRAEHAREHAAMRTQLTEFGQRLFTLTLRANEDSALHRKSSAELMHEVQRLLRALSLQPR